MKIREKILPVLQPVGGDEEIKNLSESISNGWWGNCLLYTSDAADE